MKIVKRVRMAGSRGRVRITTRMIIKLFRGQVRIKRKRNKKQYSGQVKQLSRMIIAILLYTREVEAHPDRWNNSIHLLITMVSMKKCNRSKLQSISMRFLSHPRSLEHLRSCWRAILKMPALTLYHHRRIVSHLQRRVDPSQKRNS